MMLTFDAGACSAGSRSAIAKSPFVSCRPLWITESVARGFFVIITPPVFAASLERELAVRLIFQAWVESVSRAAGSSADEICRLENITVFIGGIGHGDLRSRSGFTVDLDSLVEDDRRVVAEMNAAGGVDRFDGRRQSFIGGCGGREGSLDCCSSYKRSEDKSAIAHGFGSREG